ncbi:hypothetical protein [Bacillus sp. FJAT-50079]|uniref:hypothetical protein n=1 Tax=Bacillus sp. FJAT-50079 TaxID=2833577 RepID=UPI001BCA65EA|nr:hypothetical protein [Bacillus sp. FJAT-50079]MBS4208676.1 hypothetical protein [Bacillus sp. FJAT-50079]
MHKYLMLDRGILVGYSLTNSKITVNKIQKDTENNPLFGEEFFGNPAKRWEVRYDNSYPNVIYDPKYKIYRCYYTLFTYDESAENTSLKERASTDYIPTGSRITSLCYAESKDGIEWTKPNLGLVDFEGNKENNILFRYAHGTGVFLDEEELDPKKRYKLVTKVEYSNARHYMAVAFSEDGIHFSELQEWNKYNPAADSHNFPFRDKKTGKFMLITRTWKNGLRVSSLCESTDFINWSEPKEILRGSGYENQVYSMPIIQYAGIYLGLASMYHEGNTEADNYDTVDVELKYASTPDVWDSVSDGQYVIERGLGTYPTGEFDSGCIYAAAPIEVDGKLRVYYMGGNGKHTNFRETSFALGYLEKDKFAGYEAVDNSRDAKLVTYHFSVYGDYLSILADIEPKGHLSVAIGNKNGKVYEGFEDENCIIEKQESGYYKVTFKGKKLTDLRTLPASLHITFNKAKVYAIRGEFECQKLKY